MMVFSWPPKQCSSNFSGHWSTAYKAKKKYRADCYFITKSYDTPELEEDICLEVTFYPPSNRMDRANMPHLFKAGFDGIAEAWQVNDKRFNPVYKYADPIKNGKIAVVVRKNNA